MLSLYTEKGEGGGTKSLEMIEEEESNVAMTEFSTRRHPTAKTSLCIHSEVVGESLPEADGTHILSGHAHMGWTRWTIVQV